MADEPKKLDDTVFQANQQLGTEQAKMLLLVNAGAIVVLLAFLQAIIPPENNTPKELISIIPYGMICYMFGIIAVLFVPLFRIFGERSTHFFTISGDNSKLVHDLFFASGAFFIFGSGVIIFGAIRYL